MSLEALSYRDPDDMELVAIERLADRLQGIKAAPTRDWRGRFERSDKNEDIQIAAEVLEALVGRWRTKYRGDG